MNAICQPKGKAKEYAEWVCNDSIKNKIKS